MLKDKSAKKNSELGKAAAAEGEFDHSTPTKSQKKKKIIISIACIACVMAFLTIIYFVQKYNSPAQAFIRTFKEGDYDKANEYYMKLVAQGDYADAEQMINESTENMLLRYNNDEVTYESAAEYLCKMSDYFYIVSGSKSYQQYEQELAKLYASKTLFENAELMERNGEIAEAISAYSGVYEQDSNINTAREKVVQLKDTYREECLQSAAVFLDQSDYDSAICLISTGLQVLREDTTLLKKLEDIKSNYRENCLENVTIFLSQADYDSASSLLFTGLRVLEKDEILQKKLEEITLKEAKRLVEETNDYAKAIEIMKSITTNDIDITQLIKQYESEYKSQFFTQAQALAEERNYEEAIACLQQGTLYFGEEDAFLSKIEEYKKKLPVWLSSVTQANDTDSAIKFDPKIEDLFGNSYQECLVINFYNKYKYEIEFVPNGMYSFLKGSLFANAEAGAEFSGTVKVYADEVLVYSSTEVNKKTNAVLLDIDIKNAKFLRIVAEGNRQTYYSWGVGTSERNYLIIGNAQLCN